MVSLAWSKNTTKIGSLNAKCKTQDASPHFTFNELHLWYQGQIQVLVTQTVIFLNSTFIYFKISQTSPPLKTGEIQESNEILEWDLWVVYHIALHLSLKEKVTLNTIWSAVLISNTIWNKLVKRTKLLSQLCY